MTRAEKVAAAFALRQEGLLLKQIAERMGVAIQTVSDWLTDPDGSRLRARKDGYRGCCEVCGQPTDGSKGRARAPHRCKDCFEPKVIWTRKRIVAAIQAFVDTHGRPPTATEWQSGHEHPSSNTVSRVFGSWNASIAAAGCTPLPVGQHQSNRAKVAA